jgi:hypothetical protein
MTDDLKGVKEELRGLRQDILKLSDYDQRIKAPKQAVFRQGA